MPRVIDEFIEASNKRRISDRLACHVCHSETHPNCQNLTEDNHGVFGYSRECDKNSTFCLVHTIFLYFLRIQANLIRIFVTKNIRFENSPLHWQMKMKPCPWKYLESKETALLNVSQAVLSWEKGQGCKSFFIAIFCLF